IVVFHAAAESEGHQILCERRDKELGMRQKGVFESVDSTELPASGYGARCIHGLAVHLEVAPLPDRIEILERKTYPVDGAMTTRAYRVFAMRSQARPHGEIGGHLAFIEGRDIRWRGRRRRA